MFFMLTIGKYINIGDGISMMIQMILIAMMLIWHIPLDDVEKSPIELHPSLQTQIPDRVSQTPLLEHTGRGGYEGQEISVLLFIFVDQQ